MDILIEIDELVLHGFPPGDRYRIGEAVQAELVRILGERGLPGARTEGAATRLDGGAFNIAPGMPALAIGTGLLLYGCLVSTLKSRTFAFLGVALYATSGLAFGWPPTGTT